jgi:uncharacterized membrane protein HdeD (DUF308 family)
MNTFVASSARDLWKSRLWLIVGGVLSLLVGFSAIRSPQIYSQVFTQFLAIVILLNGGIALLLAVLGKHKGHRILEALSGLIRIAAGITLLYCLTSSMQMITLILAIFLMVEGVTVAASSLALRSTPGWFWILINGLASLALGIMIHYRWPSSTESTLGLLIGISLLFNGSTLLALGLSVRKPPAA